MSIEYLGLLIALILFMGFWVENIWIAVTKGYIDNRNFRLPFLLGYGLFVVGFALCFGTPDNVPLKLSKYTAIPTSIAFAFMVTFFMDYLPNLL